MQTILLVEDDETLRKNIAFALESEGYSVIKADNLQTAEQYVNSVDLLLLDVILPDGSGKDLCKKIRNSTQIPVIFLTSCDDEADIVEGLDIGGDDYITKPFRLRELISRIRANIRRVPVPPQIELTAVEQRLLDYLMCNRGQYLTREQILDHLWDCKGIFVNDNTLSVNISRLRDKLEKSGGGQIITKRGLGYKWIQ